MVKLNRKGKATAMQVAHHLHVVKCKECNKKLKEIEEHSKGDLK